MSSQTANLFALLSRRIDAFSDMAAVRFVSRAHRIRDFERLTKLVESLAYSCRKGVRFSPPPPKFYPPCAVKIFADGNERELQAARLDSSRSRQFNSHKTRGGMAQLVERCVRNA